MLSRAELQQWPMTYHIGKDIYILVDYENAANAIILVRLVLSSSFS